MIYLFTKFHLYNYTGLLVLQSNKKLNKILARMSYSYFTL